MHERFSNTSTRIGVGLAVGAILLTGCSSEGSPTDVPSSEYSSSSLAPSAPGVTMPEVSPTTEAPLQIPTSVELLSNPDLLRTAIPRLPNAVLTAAGAAVEVHADATQITDTYSNGQIISSESSFAYRDDAPGVLDGEDGSGVVVRTSSGQEAVLSAGHVIASTTHCAEMTVNYQVSSDQQVSQTAHRRAVDYNGRPGDEGITMPDVGIVITNSDGVNHAAAQLVSQSVMNPGDVLFALTYQPEADGTQRNPGNADDTKYPAEYSAMVLGKDPMTGLIAALERGPSLGKTEDNQSRSGASGGEIVDPSGRIVGIVEGAPQDPASTAFAISEARMAAKNPSDLSNLNYEPGDGVVYIQPVDQSMVDNLYAQANKAPDCLARPHKSVGK